MNIYDHEDAFKFANRIAGKLTKLSDALKICNTQEQARLVILDCQEKYEALFEAFIAGVDYGRKNPKDEKVK